MKTTIATFGALLCLSFGFVAQAADNDGVIVKHSHEPFYACQLSGDVQGVSVAIFFGGEVISGTGVLTCVNENTRQQLTTPVKLALLGGGVGFDFSLIRHIGIKSASVRVSNPSQLIQTFGIGASAGATLIHNGIGFDVAATLTDPNGLGFEVGFTGQDAIGLGAHLYAMTFQVQKM